MSLSCYNLPRNTVYIICAQFLKTILLPIFLISTATVDVTTTILNPVHIHLTMLNHRLTVVISYRLLSFIIN